MAQAVLTAQTATIGKILEQTKTLMTINAWIRDYPELMYVGLYMNNLYTDGGKMKMGWFTFAEQKTLSFKNIGNLSSTMTVNENEVVWYEAWLYTEEAAIAEAIATASPVVKLSASDIKYFKVKDVVMVKPKAGSTTNEVQAKITAVDLVANKVTLDTSITCALWDRLVFLYNSITYWTEISRGIWEHNATPVRTYFQTFGESVEFNSNEINQTRLLTDAKQYVTSRFATALNSCNNRFAKAFYAWRNVAWAESETQGLDAVIEEIESRDWVGSAIVDFSSHTTWKEKALALVETINRACSAPVYNWAEVPTVYVNNSAITALSMIKFDMGNFFTLEQKEIDFGIQAYSSPFFRNVQFIVSNTLNKLEPNKSVMYMFPKHLVSFKTPEYQSVNEQWALITNKMGWYQVMKMPQVSPDKVKYTAQMRLANIFGWQSFRNTYLKIENI